MNHFCCLEMERTMSTLRTPATVRVTKRGKTKPRVNPAPNHTGWTDANGLRTPDAPEDWPFGRCSPEERLALALRAVLRGIGRD